MEDKAIEKVFAHLKLESEYGVLYVEARCRERADWISRISLSVFFNLIARH